MRCTPGTIAIIVMGEIVPRPVPLAPMPFTGERLTSDYGGQTKFEHLHRYLLAREFCRGMEVLDVASGEGYGAALIAQIARSVVGIEIASEAVAHATTSYACPNLRFLAGDARALPLPDAAFDVAVSFETIEHFAEQERFVAEVRRVLRPGGLFIVSTPDRDNYSPAEAPANPYHVRELTCDEFLALLRGQFADVDLLLQRPVLGSVLLPCKGGESTPLCFERRGANHFEASSGLARAQYLIAFASGKPIGHSLPASVYIETARLGALDPDEMQARLDALTTECDGIRSDLVTARSRVKELEEACCPGGGFGGRAQSGQVPVGRSTCRGSRADIRKRDGRACVRLPARRAGAGPRGCRQMSLSGAGARGGPGGARQDQEAPRENARVAPMASGLAASETVQAAIPSTMTLPVPSSGSLLEQVTASTSPGPFHERDVGGHPAPANPKVRLIAFYLPQFHPIPENDVWWGTGFTDWTNVTRAIPRFAGHIQPRLPGELGFYDLRDASILRRQAVLARRYGIGGFCFHHYWFGGRRLLERPLDLLLANQDIDLPFCINWANENWTRRWDGLDHEILIAQSHSAEDDEAFARSVVPIIRDSRYIHINGRPLLMIYRPGLLPEPIATIRRWRAELTRAGLGNPFVVMAQGFGTDDPTPFGIDAAVEFPPHKLAVTPLINGALQVFDPDFCGHVMDYAEIARRAASRPRPPFRLFRGVCPGWDNEPRQPGRGLVMAFSNPAKYGEWLGAACRAALAEADHPDERIVFVNAWNEWAEGAYLEPDRHYGYAYLAETARVLSALAAHGAATARLQVARQGPPRIALVSHDAHLHGAQMVALGVARSLVRDHGGALTILLGGAGDLSPDFAAIAPTEMVAGDFADPAAWHAAARRLASSGVTAVLCNTLVSAKAIGALRDAGLRIVQLVHELPSLIGQYGLESAARDAASHAAAIVFPSAYVRDRFVEVAGEPRGQVILRHQGVSLRQLSENERRQQRAEIRAAWGLGAAQRVVLGVGYGDVRKGLDLWPGLIRRVVSACPDAYFVWAGKVDPTLARWLAHDLGALDVQDRLRFEAPRRDLSGIYAAADVLALTSREDPFPSVVLEAMASRLPVVLFENSGGITELVREAGGSCVPYLDLDGMARELCRLLGDPLAAAAVGAAMHAHVERDLDYRSYTKLLLALAVPTLPSVSVVVPNFNYARYLRRRLESIWAQTFPIHEILLLDDASTDDSEAVIAALVTEFPVPVRVVRNEVNSGSVARQWARGVTLAQGDLVWIAEADDVAEPGFLAATVAAFDDPEIVLSYCESRMIDENGRGACRKLPRLCR